jgi:hypothetical protein
MASSDQNDPRAEAGWQGTNVMTIELLEHVRDRGRVWEDLAAEYGVTNPDPPWKLTLEATCDLLAADSCIIPYDQVKPGSCALPSLERRAEEDDLSATIYADVPYPEAQLLSLAHSMIKRGYFSEEELARRMESVERRLNSA